MNYAETIFPQLHDRGLQVTDGQINELSRKTSISFDSKIVSFWKQFNGGQFYTPTKYPDSDVAFTDPTRGDDITEVQFFSLNILEWASWRDIYSVWEMHDTRVPAGALPIGRTIGSDLILYDSHRDGQIILWEREQELRVAPEESRVFLATSIEEFASRLVFKPIQERRENALYEEEPEQSIEVHDLLALKDWLKERPSTSRERDEEYCLRLACFESFYEGVEFLLAKGVDPSLKGPPRGRSALELAVNAGAGDIVIMLLDAGVGAREFDQLQDSNHNEEYLKPFVDQWRRGIRQLFKKW